MSPYETIKAKYEASEHADPWLTVLEQYHSHGFVFSTPVFFVAGIEARLDEKDCWYVFAASGDIGKMWDMLPYPLGWIAFERIHNDKRDLRIYPTDVLRRLSNKAPLTHDSLLADKPLA